MDRSEAFAEEKCCELYIFGFFFACVRKWTWHSLNACCNTVLMHACTVEKRCGICWLWRSTSNGCGCWENDFWCARDWCHTKRPPHQGIYLLLVISLASNFDWIQRQKFEAMAQWCIGSLLSCFFYVKFQLFMLLFCWSVGVIGNKCRFWTLIWHGACTRSQMGSGGVYRSAWGYSVLIRCACLPLPTIIFLSTEWLKVM